MLLEPIQGEQGVVVPPDGLPARRPRALHAHDVLLVADEIQSGLGRTGTTLASELVGRAAGPGHPRQGARRRRSCPCPPSSAAADVLGVLTAGTHGSTFGGNPLACAVGLAVVGLLETGELQARAATLGAAPAARACDALVDDGLLAASRRVGLWAGLDVGRGAAAPAVELCERLLARGVLAKDTHGSTIRLAPPLTITHGRPRPGHGPPHGRPALTRPAQRPHSRGLGPAAVRTSADRAAQRPHS